MKKKLFSFIIAFAFILIAGNFITACDGGGDNNPTSKTLTQISANVNHSKWYSDQFNYEFGETIEISESNFTVTANYSDGSTEIVTNFTLDKSFLPTGPAQGGTYTISITYSTASPIYFSVWVNAQQLENIDFSSIPTEKEFTYTGNEINIISQIPALQTLINENKVVIDDTYSNTDDIHSNTTEATNFGSYELHLKSAAGYGNSNLTIYWRINKAVVKRPIPVNTTVEYDGNPHCIEFTEELPNYMYMDYYAYTDAVSQQYIVYMKDENHIFDNDSTVAYYDFDIKPKRLTYNKSDLMVTNTIVYDPNGIDEESIETNIDTNLFNISYGSYYSAGSAELYLSAKDGVAYNHQWKNGEYVTPYDFAIEFNIAKATYTCPNNTQDNIVFETRYSDNLKLSSVLNDSNLTTDVRNWARDNINYEYYLSQFSVKEEDANATISIPGTFIKTVNYTPNDTNYETSEITVTIVINKIKITLNNSLSWGTYYIENDEKKWLNNTQIIYNGTTEYNSKVYSEITAYSEDNEDIEVALTYTNYYGTAQGEYGNTSVTAINGGYYKTVATATITKVGNKNLNGIDDYYYIAPFNSSYEWRVLPKEVYYGSWNLQFWGDYNIDHIIYKPTNDNLFTTTTINFKPSDNEDIQFNKTFYYKATNDGEYNATEDLTKVGYYKATVAIGNYDVNNYNITIAEEEMVLEWQIIPNTFDVSEVTFDVTKGQTIANGTKLEELFSNLPEYVRIVFPESYFMRDGGYSTDYYNRYTNGYEFVSSSNVIYSVLRYSFSAFEYQYYFDGTVYNPTSYVTFTGTNLTHDEEKNYDYVDLESWVTFNVGTAPTTRDDE